MQDEFDLGFDTEERKSLTLKAPGTTSMITIAIVIIAAIVSLGEFTFTINGVVNITVTVAVLYVVASIIYSNSYLNGIKRGKSTPEYISAKSEYDESLKQINKLGMLSKMSEYCLRYCEEELKNCRAAVLLDACISYDDYKDKYLGKTEDELKELELSDDAIKCILDANRLKAVNITPSRLTGTGEDSSIYERLSKILGIRRTLGIESKTRQHIDYGTNMVSRALTTCLAGVVGISMFVDDFSFRTIALWAMKMLPIAIAALGGNNSGCRNVLYTLTPQLQRKTKIMKTMIGWHTEKQ